MITGMSHIDMIMLLVDMIMLHVDMIMLHADIIYFALGGGRGEGAKVCHVA